MMCELDCGDNSCHFAKSKGGMRTNGGCRCISNAGFERSAISSAYKMLPEILDLRTERARLATENEELRGKLGIARDALEGIFSLFDEGFLVRDVSRDGEADFALRMMRPTGKLKDAYDALRATDEEGEK